MIFPRKNSAKFPRKTRFSRKKLILNLQRLIFSNLSSGSEETKIAAWADFANLFEVNSNVGKIPDLENVIGKELRNLLLTPSNKSAWTKNFARETQKISQFLHSRNWARIKRKFLRKIKKISLF